MNLMIGDKLIFQHQPGGPEHPCSVVWLKHPPVDGAVLVRFDNGTTQWVNKAQLRPDERTAQESAGGDDDDIPF